jgi:hypothetical protein
VPLSAGRNFDGILDLLQTGENIEPTEDQRSRVVQRGLDKKAPFHRSCNSVADARPIDICLRPSPALTLRRSNASFVTSNSDDSLVSGSHLVQPIGVA